MWKEKAAEGNKNAWSNYLLSNAIFWIKVRDSPRSINRFSQNNSSSATSPAMVVERLMSGHPRCQFWVGAQWHSHNHCRSATIHRRQDNKPTHYTLEYQRFKSITLFSLVKALVHQLNSHKICFSKAFTGNGQTLERNETKRNKIW